MDYAIENMGTLHSHSAIHLNVAKYSTLSVSNGNTISVQCSYSNGTNTTVYVAPGQNISLVSIDYIYVALSHAVCDVNTSRSINLSTAFVIS